MQTARWAYHYGENAPGWDFGIVLRREDPLNFYRIGLSGHVRIERRVPYAEWLHIVATHADGRVVLYVDGEPVGQATYDTDTPGFEFFMFEPAYHIGWTYGGGRHYRGDIGPIRLYAKALSAEEVAER